MEDFAKVQRRTNRIIKEINQRENDFIESMLRSSVGSKDSEEIPKKLSANDNKIELKY